MTNVSNAKKLTTWHAIALTSVALTVIIMGTSQQIAPTKSHIQAHLQDAGTTTLVDMIDQHPGVTITPGITTVTIGIDTGFSRSWSCSHNPRYRSNSHSDSHRSHSRSFHWPSCNSTSCHISSTTYCYCQDTPHCRSSSHRSFSRDDSRCRTCTSSKHHYETPKRPSSGSHQTPWKSKDRKYKQVTTDDLPSGYYSSDEQDSDSEDDLKLEEPSPSSHTWGGLPTKDAVTITHITDCSTITIYAVKHYKALIDSGAAISLLRYSTYKKIEDCYKTSIQPTTAKLNTADGSPMSALGSTALHLQIAEFKFTPQLYNLQPTARNRTHFWHRYSKEILTILCLG